LRLAVSVLDDWVVANWLLCDGACLVGVRVRFSGFDDRPRLCCTACERSLNLMDGFDLWYRNCSFFDLCVSGSLVLCILQVMVMKNSAWNFGCENWW